MGDVEQSVIAKLELHGMDNSAVGRIAINLARRLDGSAEDKEAASIVASIAKQLCAILEKIEAIPQQQGDSVDDLTAKRAARRANAANS